MRTYRLLAGASASLLWAAAGLAACPMPALQGHPVVDAAGKLTPAQKSQLEAAVNSVNARTHHQVAVVSVPPLNGEPVEDCSVALGRAWGLGSKENNDGVLLYWAPAERKMRIEVGYGLESQLTDAEANRINNTVIIPHFKQGDFEGGLEAGVAEVGTVITPPPAVSAHKPAAHHGGGMGWLLGGILGALGLGGAALWWSARRRREEKRKEEERLAHIRKLHEQERAREDQRNAESLSRLAASAAKPRAVPIVTETIPRRSPPPPPPPSSTWSPPPPPPSSWSPPPPPPSWSSPPPSPPPPSFDSGGFSGGGGSFGGGGDTSSY